MGIELAQASYSTWKVIYSMTVIRKVRILGANKTNHNSGEEKNTPDEPSHFFSTHALLAMAPRMPLM